MLLTHKFRYHGIIIAKFRTFVRFVRYFKATLHMSSIASYASLTTDVLIGCRGFFTEGLLPLLCPWAIKSSLADNTVSVEVLLTSGGSSEGYCSPWSESIWLTVEIEPIQQESVRSKISKSRNRSALAYYKQLNSNHFHSHDQLKVKSKHDYISQMHLATVTWGRFLVDCPRGWK